MSNFVEGDGVTPLVGHMGDRYDADGTCGVDRLRTAFLVDVFYGDVVFGAEVFEVLGNVR